MISAKKLQANRSNARQSTGPRSGAGKALSARNARRHGLAVPVWSDPNLAAAAEALAREIAGERPTARITALARDIAEAQIDLVRIQNFRHELLIASLPAADDALNAEMAAPTPALLSKIAAADRYER